MTTKFNFAKAVLGEDAVKPGETKSQTVPVDSSVKKLSLGLSWSGSSMDLVLRKPGGGWITRETIANDPQIAYMEGPAYKAFILSRTLPQERGRLM